MPTTNSLISRPNNLFSNTNRRALKRLFAVSRWIHIYLSTFLFTLLIFFCFTGITLNHTDWFETKGTRQTHRVELPSQWIQLLQDKEQPPIKALKSYIREHYQLVNPRSIDMDMEVGEITFDYPLPAGYAFITVFVDSTEMEIERKQGALIALLNDLHKGRHTGPVWSWVIDISAIAVILLSVTGIIILLQQKKRRGIGLILVLLGGLTPLLIFLNLFP